MPKAVPSTGANQHEEQERERHPINRVHIVRALVSVKLEDRFNILAHTSRSGRQVAGRKPALWGTGGGAYDWSYRAAQWRDRARQQTVFMGMSFFSKVV
jgi:hypothetical protein